jgi:hypothetical protein
MPTIVAGMSLTYRGVIAAKIMQFMLQIIVLQTVDAPQFLGSGFRGANA